MNDKEMSEVKRWDIDQYEGEWATMREDTRGDYILASDYATLEAENAKLRAELERRTAIFVRLDSGFDEITGLCRHLRQGGCDSTDLLGLEEGLTHAIDMAVEMRAMLAAARKGEVE